MEDAMGVGPDPWSRLGLFVVWEVARRAEAHILADLGRRFEVIRVADVRWSPHQVRRNFERFYPDLDVRGVYHAHNKGAGNMLAIVVQDPDPLIQTRDTSRGRRHVNGRFLDAKLLYRQWTDEFAIHSSETAQEARRDMFMLLGEESVVDALTPVEPWNGRVEFVERDVSGARGWATAAEMFSALNASVNYVVLGGPAADQLWDGTHEPQLLTDDYRTLRTVLDARPVAGAELPHGGAFRVRVAGRPVRLGIRIVDDGYLDPEWARACLADRVFDREHGLYRPVPTDESAIYAYTSLVHRSRPPAEFLTRLRELAATPTGAAAQAGTDWSLSDTGDVADVVSCLDRFLDVRGYRYTRPLDPSVGYYPLVSGEHGSSLRSAVDRVRRRSARLSDIARGNTARKYIGVRDWLVMRAPVVRRVKAAVSGWIQASRRPVSSLRRAIRGEAMKKTVLLVRGALFVGRRYRCPCCGWPLRGFVGRWGFLRSNPDGYCPRCNAKARHRRAWLHLQEHTAAAPRPYRVLDIAPWWSFARCARKAEFIDYVGLDIERVGPQVDIVGDVTAIPLPSDGYDVVVCVHVLEHVEDDRAAIAELFRVLRPGGFALISVPLREDGATYEDSSITEPEERLRAFGERSHVRLYGMDLEDRLHEAGFDVRVHLASALPQPTRRRFGLRDDDHIFHCSKTLPQTMTSG